MRRYRQAYHREVREGRLVNITSSQHTLPCPPHASQNHWRAAICAASSHPSRHFHPSLWIFHFQCGCGVRLSGRLSLASTTLLHHPLHPAATTNTITTIFELKIPMHCAGIYADHFSPQPPSLARVPSSTPGSSTSSRPSVSVVSLSTLPSGSSRLPSTMSPSLVCLTPWDLVAQDLLSSVTTFANTVTLQTPPVTVTSSRT